MARACALELAAWGVICRQVISLDKVEIGDSLKQTHPGLCANICIHLLGLRLHLRKNLDRRTEEREDSQ